ncbi:SF-assemblin [Hondaea fermentalgiana]|uniref:SF-assemblin n=1 Tax=Hondaea fermentalgiana TaxID=2315210 RepID=A0A2R5GF46_9STRA|nr:SF-assemblin [Hondaea fermentalgiana]|eukprot:GBG29552.1 SF-assemblin [Hondaea fermentalgiana]
MESKYNDDARLETTESSESVLAAKRGELSAASEGTKARLRTLMSNFDAFESEMIEGTRTRREKDEHVLVQLQREMASLEQVLQTEMKQRVEMNQSLQTWAGEQVEHVKEILLQKIQDKMEVLQENIDLLNERVDDLHAQLEHEKVAIPADIERRGAELTERLTAFQDRFETERLSRLEREKVITGRLADHENQVSEELDAERGEREQKYQELRAVLEESITLRKARTERFHIKIEKEIAKLKNAIQEEAVVREQEDDEIAETLTRYAAKLQDSLRTINTTEV